ncbi:RNA polymerase sigma factor [Halalkalibaculum sp. DA3122]|uniref:RNA polymerase sigma factor n=1 Tax=unclassified Halalkalibaculum TaxID=2964617 RepID=UPI0037550B7F
MDHCDKFDSLPDSEIWQLLKEGNRKALKTLFDKYYNDLYSYAYKISRDKALSKDCVQELFYRVWDRKEHLSDISSVKAYLWVSLRRDVFKAISRDDKTIHSEDIISYPELLSFTHEDFIIQKEKKEEQKEALLRALNNLPDRHREAIFLKYFNGLSYSEIQQVMSVNYQTARNYIYHGVKALKKEFEGKIFVSSIKEAI